MYPTDTVKSKMQADSLTNPRYTNFMDCVKQTFKEGGIRSFYKGVGVCCFRGALTNAGGFYAFEEFRRYIEKKYSNRQ